MRSKNSHQNAQVSNSWRQTRSTRARLARRLTIELLEDRWLLVAAVSDYGDAPESYSQVASHLDVGPMLGIIRDKELGTQFSPYATGDDESNSTGDNSLADDEDGITFGVLNKAVGSATMQVTIGNLSTTVADSWTVVAWIDFNHNNLWETSERVVNDQDNSGASQGPTLTRGYPISIPNDAIIGPTFARVRIVAGHTRSLEPSSAEASGEVEDYLVTIVAPPTDIGLSPNTIIEKSAPNSVVGSLLVQDAELGTPTNDSFTYSLVPGGGDAHNAAFAIIGNQLRLIASPDYETQSLYALRVRTTDSHGLSFEKALLVYVLNVEEADFGDAPTPYPTTLLQNGARHEATGPRLGAARDIEVDGIPSFNAYGDGNDDDGVAFGVLKVGQLAFTPIDFPIVPAIGTVRVSVENVIVGNAPNGVFLDAWIDFNNDGAWGGPGEQIFESKSVIAGDNTLTFNIPSYAIAGKTFARFRLSTAGNLGVGGYASDGEVEDYAVTILPSTSLVSSGVTPEARGDAVTFALGSVVPGLFPSISTVYAADLDGDGDMDSLTASFDNGQIAWQANNGTGTFTSQGIIATIGGATSAIAADVDGDGRLDVIATSYHNNSVLWYKNAVINGAVFFVPQDTIDTNATLVAKVFAADMDNDGDIDLLSASVGNGTTGGVIKLYVNNGPSNPGFFTTRVVRSGLNAAYDVTAADIDRDGKLDIVSAALGSGGDNGVRWYKNDGALGFANSFLLTAVGATGVHRVITADLDQDGDMDIIASSISDNKITWYRNNGSQIFSAQVIAADASGVRSIEVADLDGDNDMDILASLYGANTFVWYSNNGSQNFSRQTIESSLNGAHSTVAADLDGDGDLDILAGAYVAGVVKWYKNEFLLDFGDAPDSYGTTVANNGARHVAAGGFLGLRRDSESDGLPGINADRDDTNANGDDEDGVTFSTIQVGQLGALVTVTVSGAIRSSRLSAWIDFNGDGTWDEEGERILRSETVFNGTNVLDFRVPGSAKLGATYARFRLTTAYGLGPTGFAVDGEVEDYRVTITGATPLQLGVPFTVLTPAGAFSSQVFKLDVTQASPLVIQVDDADSTHDYRVYARSNAIPTYGFYVGFSAKEPRSVAIPLAAPGEFYVTISTGRPSYVTLPVEFTLRVDAEPVVVKSVSPNLFLAGNAQAKVIVSGQGFAVGTQVSLIPRGGGVAIPSQSTSIDSWNQITALFNLATAPIGDYDVRVTVAAGLVKTRAAAVKVIAAGQGILKTRLISPGHLGRYAPDTLYVEYSNEGTAPIESPILVLKCSRPNYGHSSGRIMTVWISSSFEGLVAELL